MIAKSQRYKDVGFCFSKIFFTTDGSISGSPLKVIASAGGQYIAVSYKFKTCPIVENPR